MTARARPCSAEAACPRALLEELEKTARVRPQSAGYIGYAASARLHEMMGATRPRSANAVSSARRREVATLVGCNVQDLLRGYGLSYAQQAAPSSGSSEEQSRSTLSLPLVLPEDLLARSCEASTAVDLAALTGACSALALVIKQIVTRLLRDVHALDWHPCASLRIPRFRQLHILEQMARLAVPAMTVFRQPVVVAANFGTLALTLQGTLPERVKVMSVACGRRHMVSLDQHGRAWAVGDGRAGGISLDSKEELPRPTLIIALGQVKLKKAACGNDHTVAMAANGDIFTWGRILGHMAATDHASDVEWQLPDANRGLAGEAVDIGAGDTHVAAVSLTGDTYMWGHNHHGQCGRDPSGSTCFFAPVRVGGALASAVARHAACGKYHTVVLSADGAVFSFGAGMCGQLGRNSTFAAGSSPKPCPSPWESARVEFAASGTDLPVYIVQVVCGDEHTLCLSDAGQVFAFGSGSHGQLAQGGVKNLRVPVPVRMRVRLCEISAGANWSLLRDRQGKVFQAGRDESDADDCRLLRQVLP